MLWNCVIHLAQGKVHEQPPKHGSGFSEPRCFDLFWPPNVDSSRWIIFHHWHRLWGWLTWGDLGGDFLDFLTLFNHLNSWFNHLNSCFIDLNSWFMHLNSWKFIHLNSWMFIDSFISNHPWSLDRCPEIFSNCCRWSRWTKTPPSYVPPGHRIRAIFWAGLNNYTLRFCNQIAKVYFLGVYLYITYIYCDQFEIFNSSY